MLPRRGNFRPLEVPQIKMFEATLQIISGLWWKVKEFCVCSKKYLLVYSFCFSTNENGPVFGSRNATWRFRTQMKFLNQRNDDLVTRMSSKQFKEFESFELFLSTATNNKTTTHQQQQQPEQLLSFGRVRFLHLHKMTMLIAGLFNLGLCMFPTWPACDTHVTAF